MEAMAGNAWQQQKQRMCIDQVQNQRTTKEENSCTMHMHITCASLIVHIKLEGSSCSLSVHLLLLCVPLSCTALYSLYSLSRGFLVWWVFLVFFLCNGQFSICSKQKKRNTLSNIGKRCVKTLQKQISLFVRTSKYLNWIEVFGCLYK